MRQQERPAAAAFHLVSGSGGIVGLHHLRYAAQGPQRILNSLLEGQEGLAGGDYKGRRENVPRGRPDRLVWVS